MAAGNSNKLVLPS